MGTLVFISRCSTNVFMLTGSSNQSLLEFVVEGEQLFTSAWGNIFVCRWKGRGCTARFSLVQRDGYLQTGARYHEIRLSVPSALRATSPASLSGVYEQRTSAM